MIHFFTPEIDYNQEKIYDRLQIRENTRAYFYVEKLFPEILELTKKNMDLFLCYRVLTPEFKFDIPILDNCKKWIVCLVSCPDQIFEVIQNKMDNDEFLEGYLINDLSNEILFNASLQMNRQISDEMKKENLTLTHRFSPGEPPFDLVNQKKLLGLLQEKIDVPISLTSHYMLRPEKSMLYLFGADCGIDAGSIEHNCATCSMRNCTYSMASGKCNHS